MGNKWNKFLLLSWKNWVLLKRAPILAVFMICLPILLTSLLVVIRNLLNYEHRPQVYYEPFPVLSSNQFYPALPRIVLYSPSNNRRIEAIIADLNVDFDFNATYSFNNSKEMELFYGNEISGKDKETTAAIQFNDDLVDKDDIPNNVNISLRFPSDDRTGRKYQWWTMFLFPIFQLPGPRNPEFQFGDNPDYYGKGFLTLQQAVAYSIMKTSKDPRDMKTVPKILLQRYPYPDYNDDAFYTAMENAFGLLVMLSFMFTFINCVRAITTEKEKQLKESMKIMGLPGWLHWLAWFLRTFILMFIGIVGIVIILKIDFKTAPVLIHSDAFLFLVFMIIYGCATITLAFLLSVFFSKANTAAAFAGFIWFLTYIPYTLLEQPEEPSSLGAKLGTSLLSNTGLCYGLLMYLKYEGLEEGVQWSNMFTPVSPDDDLTFGAIFIVMIIDTVLYLVLALYIEAVFPGDFGMPLPWYFPFTKTYWCRPSAATIHVGDTAQNQGEFFENCENLPAGIEIKNLTKQFGPNTAVNKLNLDLYEDQITVLLGHNGAGKTTTMSMLTGMFPPTGGTAIVNGFDVRTNISGVRDSMGLCLQHNVLFDNMTVWEHLYFFGRLKGLKKDEIDEEINKYIKLLELEDKTHARTSTLSGGMKRKVSVGMALCGRSKVVMLDEPTAGMDPSARRAIWDLLQKQKSGRTILLTTHFMDEADLLGDRIAIMSAGQLQCCGSSFFLKKKYGAGYYLIVDKLQKCIPDKITRLLRKHIPNMEIESNIGSELTYLLPENESKRFEKMLHDLEQNSESLGIGSYGVSLTTLEEVFMKVGADKDNQVSLHNISKENELHGSDTRVNVESAMIDKRSLLVGGKLYKNQFIAMFMKKALSHWRSWILLLLQILVPLGLLLLIMSNQESLAINLPRLLLSLEKYVEPMTFFSGDRTGKICGAYEAMMTTNNYGLEYVNNFTSHILKKTKEIPSTVKTRYIVSANFDEAGSNTITAWFNGDPFHASPLSLGLILNAMYKKYYGEDHGMIFNNYPLPYDLKTQIASMNFNLIGYQLAVQLGYGLSFVASFYIIFCIRERMTKSKHLQFVSGMNPFIFWTTAFAWDMFIYLIIMLSAIIGLLIIQKEGFSSAAEIGRVLVILLYFGVSVLPFMYICSFLFTVPSSGFSRLMLIGAVTGIAGMVTMSVLEVDDLDLMYVARPLHWILLFFPFYSICKGIYDISDVATTKNTCKYLSDLLPDQTQVCSILPDCCRDITYFGWESPGIGRNIVISVLMTIVLFTILYCNEYGFFSFVMYKIMPKQPQPKPADHEDSDVHAENKNIRSQNLTDLQKSYILVLKDVTKFYKKFLAVNNLCLGIKPYECFGLLGVNGAGKTTTFKMMTGDERISYGDAWINGSSVTSNQKQVQKFIGYCPQFDALLDDLTARETLIIFGLIRGVPKSDCNGMGEKLAHDFDFYKHLDKKVKELSGGNKRKLSTALALIGDPPVIFLDEPTTGMDPATKRYLWNALCKLRDSGKSIVLTSHSMEECEAMCTRLVIMVNGAFQCLGSTQHLKHKFAQGYTLTIKLKKGEHVDLERECDIVEDFILSHFNGAHLKEKHRELLTYQLTDTSMPWSRMFGILEKSKRELNIEDYSLGQCSLEQVFLSFTKYQT